MSNILLLLPTRILKQDDCMTEILFSSFFSLIHTSIVELISRLNTMYSKKNQIFGNYFQFKPIEFHFDAVDFFLLILFIDKLNGHKKVVFFPKKKKKIRLFNFKFYS